MTKPIGLALLVALLLSACGGAAPAATPTPEYRGSVLEEPLSVPDLVLTDQYGQPFSISEQQGKVLLLFFGYTNCPDVCPTTLATWRSVHEELGNDADNVRFAFVTVDPERDSQERLGRHVNAFNPDFIGLRGTTEELEAVYDFFDVYYEKDTSSGSALGYLVSHTATTFVVDPEGQWRLRETYGTPVEDIVKDVRILLEDQE